MEKQELASQPNYNLDLDPSVIKEKGNVYTSLTDRYSIGVFTNSFQKAKEKVENESESQREKTFQNIFTGNYIEEETFEIESLLFLEKKEQIIEKDNTGTSASYDFWFGLAIFGAALLFAAALSRYHFRKKKEREASIADIKLEHPA